MGFLSFIITSDIIQHIYQTFFMDKVFIILTATWYDKHW